MSRAGTTETFRCQSRSAGENHNDIRSDLLSTTPVMLAMVQEHAPQNPAGANGLFMMISFMARSAIVVLVGVCGDVVGLHFTYLISCGLGFLGIPFVLLPPRTTEKSTRIEP